MKFNEQKKDFKEIWKRIKTRDFSGNTGIAVKNSLFNLGTTFISRIGTLIFTIILARILLPELFGLYSLAISTILIFTALSSLGFGNSLVYFVSKELSKNNKSKAKAYTLHIFKTHIFFIFLAIFLLIVLAKPLSSFYQKPLFLALIAGASYLFFAKIAAFIDSLLQSVNCFKGNFYRQLIFQVSRIILVPVAAFLVLKYSPDKNIMLFVVISVLSFSYFLNAFTIFLFSRRKIGFLKSKKISLKNEEKKQLNKFLLAMSATTLTLAFFGYVDMLMLGRFVLAEFIGYYKISLSFISAAAPLIAFSTVLLPIFSRLKGEELKRGLKKSVRLTLILSVILFVTTFLLAPIIIKIIYGSAYTPSISILRIFSFLFLIVPITGIYHTYIISQGKPHKIAKLLVIAIIINIVLNYILITSLLQYGNLAAVFGVVAATMISKLFYLGGLIFIRKKA